MRGTAFGCVTMPLIAAIGILGCTAGRMAERAQPDVGAARYVLRWEECAEPAEGRARASQWSCHEITSQEGRRAVAAWLEANRESMHPPNGMIPLPYSPAKELFCFQDDGTCQFWELRFWDIRRHVRPVSALRNWSKAELLQVNWSPNLPVQQFIALQDVFRRHGRPVEPNEDLDRIRDKHAAPSLVPDQGRFVLLSRQEETSPPNEWAVWAIDDEAGRPSRSGSWPTMRPSSVLMRCRAIWQCSPNTGCSGLMPDSRTMPSTYPGAMMCPCCLTSP